VAGFFKAEFAEADHEVGDAEFGAEEFHVLVDCAGAAAFEAEADVHGTVVGLDVELVENFEPEEIGDGCAHRPFEAGGGGGDEFVVGGFDDFGEGLADFDGEAAEVVTFGHPEGIAGGAGAFVDGGQAKTVGLVGGEKVRFLFLRSGREWADREIGVPGGMVAFLAAFGGAIWRRNLLRREGDSLLFPGGGAGLASRVFLAGKQATVAGGDAGFDLSLVVELGEGFPVAGVGGEGGGVGGVEGGKFGAALGGGHGGLLDSMCTCVYYTNLRIAEAEMDCKENFRSRVGTCVHVWS
jgi:hypothetical protein